jgi:hypothetical protein
VTPLAIELLTAVSSAEEALPPRLMLATDRAAWFEVTQFTPAMTPELLPLPLQSSTRTGTRLTPYATP